MDEETRQEFNKLHERLNKIQEENNHRHKKIYQQNIGRDAKIEALEERVSSIERVVFS